MLTVFGTMADEVASVARANLAQDIRRYEIPGNAAGSAGGNSS
jgi:hypothetical protein